MRQEVCVPQVGAHLRTVASCARLALPSAESLPYGIRGCFGWMQPDASRRTLRWDQFASKFVPDADVLLEEPDSLRLRARFRTHARSHRHGMPGWNRLRRSQPSSRHCVQMALVVASEGGAHRIGLSSERARGAHVSKG